MRHDTVAVVVKDGDKFLLGKRLNRPNKGYWTLPGGHVDEGESVFEAAKREAREEIGEVKLDETPLMDFVHSTRLGHEHHVFVFSGGPSGEIRAASDVGEIRWLTLEEIADIDITNFAITIFNRMFPDVTKGDLKNEGK